MEGGGKKKGICKRAASHQLSSHDRSEVDVMEYWGSGDVMKREKKELVVEEKEGTRKGGKKSGKKNEWGWEKDIGACVLGDGGEVGMGGAVSVLRRGEKERKRKKMM